jgi:hypothetical protein
MARQAMGKGKMGKVQVADLKVAAGSTIYNQKGEAFTLPNDIVAVYVMVSKGIATYSFNCMVFTTDAANVEII